MQLNVTRPFLMVLFSLLATQSWAAEEASDSHVEEIEVVESHDRSVFSISPGFILLTNDSQSLHSLGIQLGYRYSFSHRFGLNVGLRQAVSIESFSNVFSEISVGLTYAITGSLLRNRQKVRLAGQETADKLGAVPTGLRSTLAFKQYFFSGSTSVVPLAGPSLAISYAFPSMGAFAPTVGARVDHVFNGDIDLTPIEFFVGFSFWL